MYFNKFSTRIKLNRQFSLSFRNSFKAQLMEKMYVFSHMVKQVPAKLILCWVWVRMFKINKEFINKEVWFVEVLS